MASLFSAGTTPNYADGGLYLGTHGVLRGRDPCLRRIEDQQQVFQKLYQDFLAKEPVECGCLHELKLAKRYSDSELVVLHENQYRDLEEGLLCPLTVRKGNPICAHVTEKYSPDPFGDELKELISESVADPVSWDAWYVKMKDDIRKVDSLLANERRAADEDSVTSIRAKQTPIVRELIRVRTLWMHTLAELTTRPFTFIERNTPVRTRPSVGMGV